MQWVLSVVIGVAEQIIRNVVETSVVSAMSTLTYNILKYVVAALVASVLLIVLTALISRYTGLDNAVDGVRHALYYVNIVSILVAAIIVGSWWFLATAVAAVLLILICVDGIFGTTTAPEYTDVVRQAAEDIIEAGVDIITDAASGLSKFIVPVVIAVVAYFGFKTLSNPRSKSSA